MTNSQAAPPLDAPASSGPSGDVRAAFGRELKALKEAAGWTTEEAAERANITRKTWGRIEAGAPVRGHSIRGVERAFEVPAGSFAKAYAGEETLTEAYRQIVGSLAKSTGINPPEGISGKAGNSVAAKEWPQTLRRFQEIIPALPNVALADIAASIRATLLTRREQLKDQIAIFEKQREHSFIQRHRAYADAAMLEAQLDVTMAALDIEKDDYKKSELSARVRHLELQLARVKENAFAAATSADQATYVVVAAQEQLKQIDQLVSNHGDIR